MLRNNSPLLSLMREALIKGFLILPALAALPLAAHADAPQISPSLK